MILIFIRSVITYFLILIVMRLMGKRQIGEMQPFELVLTLIIAELACIPMADNSIPLLYGMIAILSLFTLHQITVIFVKRFLPIRRLLSGRPTVVLTPGGIDFKELKKLNMTISDLLEAMRDKGYFNFDMIDYGLFETNGQFSVIPSKKFNKTDGEGELPYTVIEDGKLIKTTLETLNLSREWLGKRLDSNKINRIKDVLVATIDKNGKMYIQCKQGKPIILSKTI